MTSLGNRKIMDMEKLMEKLSDMLFRTLGCLEDGPVDGSVTLRVSEPEDGSRFLVDYDTADLGLIPIMLEADEDLFIAAYCAMIKSFSELDSEHLEDALNTFCALCRSAHLDIKGKIEVNIRQGSIKS